MPEPVRITDPLLDVLATFLQAWSDEEDLHGWAIIKKVQRSGPTVYGVLDRLEDAGWVTGRWEDQNPEPGRPRRRFYRLTPTGAEAARGLLAARRQASRPSTLRPKPGLALIARLRSRRLVGGQ